MPDQKAVTRIQAQVKLDFSSERHATISLEQIHLGQLNAQIPQPERVKPMRVFETMRIAEEKRRSLELPAQFIYADGVIERIQFHPQDEAWSKNIKRAVLNMIQLNLKTKQRSRPANGGRITKPANDERGGDGPATAVLRSSRDHH